MKRTPENRHMIAWLRARSCAALDSPHTDAQWQRFTDAAKRAGVCGLLLEQASHYDLPLPQHVAVGLQDRAMAVAAANMNLTGELERLLCVFNKSDIPVMLLKGAALNLTLYGRADLRPMTDLDLLIKPDSAEATLRLLEEHGCRRGLDLVRDDFFPRYHYETEVITDSPRRVRIDLHARPFRPLRIARTMPDDAFWHDAQPVDLGESNALIPRPEVMLIHLAAHVAFHGYSRLLWMYDIKRLVEEYGQSMDWSLVTRRAHQWRLSLPVLRAIERTEELLGPVCPRPVVDHLAAHKTSWRDRMTLAHAPHDAASPVAHVAVNLLCTSGIRFRIGYLSAFLLPGRAHLAGVYRFRHPGWVPCAHLWRSLRTLGRIVCVPWYALRRLPGTLRA